jgi:hypothetical protein
MTQLMGVGMRGVIRQSTRFYIFFVNTKNLLLYQAMLRIPRALPVPTFYRVELTQEKFCMHNIGTVLYYIRP